MKNKFTSGLCVMMCLVLVLSMFAACSIKDKNTDNTTTTLSPDNQWYVGNGTYEPVTLTNIELVELVNQALGEEAKDFTGDLSTLTPEQIQKVGHECRGIGIGSSVAPITSGNLTLSHRISTLSVG